MNVRCGSDDTDDSNVYHDHFGAQKENSELSGIPFTGQPQNGPRDLE